VASRNILSADLVKSFDMVRADARLGNMPEPSACSVAYQEYSRLSGFRTLFTAVVLVLVAATVVFLVTMLSFLALTVFRWDEKDTVVNVVKAVTTLGTAAGALVTGAAAKMVYDEKRAQDVLVASAQDVVNKYCKPTS
jgi:hypothetical protein